MTDVDRARDFYAQVGCTVDHDQTVSDDIRFVQLTPPGSACSIAVGRGLTAMAPGSLDNLRRVGSGRALLGFAQADAAADAVMGTGAAGQRHAASGTPASFVAATSTAYARPGVRSGTVTVRSAAPTRMTWSMPLPVMRTR